MKNLRTNLITKIKGVASNSKACAAIKSAALTVVTGIVTMSYSVASFATQNPSAEVDTSQGQDLSGVVDPIVGLINSFVNPLLALVGAGGTIFCILLGVKFATAEEPQEREKRKQALKTALIGFVLIFVLIVALKLSIGPLTTWMNNSLTSQSST